MEEKKPFLIPAENLGELEFRLEGLNKRAAKLGVPEIVTKVLGVVFDKKGHRYFSLEVEGVAPKLPGWTFYGTLEHTTAGNILRSVPGFEIPESYRTSPPQCDHCQKIRRRKDTYVVRDDAGSFKQVGHQCVRDFLGHVDPRALARMAELNKLFEEATNAEEEGFGFNMSGRYLDYTLDFLAMTVEVIKKSGWVSKSAAKAYAEKSEGAAYLIPTADTAWRYLHPTREMLDKGDTLTVTAESLSLAKEALEFTQKIDARSEYEGNIKVNASNQYMDRKNAGLVASIAPYYQKELARREERKNKMAELEKSQFFGTVGRREIFTLLVDGENRFESQYNRNGLSLYRMRDQAGNVAVWWTAPGSLEVGKTYALKATVKKHEVYKTIRQTTLSRCTIVDVVTEKVA